MQLSDELLQLYKSNVKITTEVEKIFKPKRYYKRADLQRLANRWYGMIDTSRVLVSIYAQPKRNSIKIPFLELTPVDNKTTEFVKIETKTYVLRTMGYNFECPKQVLNEAMHHALEKFWDDVSRLGAIELIT